MMDDPRYLGSATQKSSVLPQFGPEVASRLQGASQQSGTRIAGALLNRLLSFIELFNSNAAQAMTSENAVHAQLDCLYEIEQIAYTWQRECNAQANEPDRKAMNALLAGLEENHRSLVTQCCVMRYSLWVKPGTKEGVGKEMKDLWESITNGRGNIQIVSADQEFANSIRASIAKLLQAPYGRGILSTLNNQQPSANKPIWIGENWRGKFTEVAREDAWKSGSGVFPVACVRDPNDRSHRWVSPTQAGDGTGSYVQIDTKPSPPLVGLGNEPLYMPDFITLGHELGHAFHNLQGQSLDPDSTPPGYPTDDTEQDYIKRRAWSEPEEYQNITQHENTLRVEHGLPKRKYHADMEAFQQEVLPSLRKWELQLRLNRAEEKIPLEVSRAVRARLPALDSIGEILIDTSLWSAPGTLDDLQSQLEKVEQALDQVIAEERNRGQDNCILS